ncbi:MAG TPA: class I SAM-dependent methyltransferase [Lachnospiraceae bacterium]|nr:class I SAM-dependent methyltransferase [Lachnospiraceae bacterium]HPF29259.1 class I SAM-dependent methyltransferase [Lachnospiraceae bacterium]
MGTTANGRFDDNWPLFEKMLGYFRYFKIKKYIKSEKKPVCVDIGCGFNGRFLHSIASQIDTGYGFDLRANDVVHENIHIINNSKFNGNLPLESGTVDRVFLLAVIEHLEQDNGLITEASRVLKPGGLLIITTPTPAAKPVLEFLSYKLHIISRESIEEHKHYYTKQELIDCLAKGNCACHKYQKFQCGFNEMIIGRKEA